jgi:hypothetical protein
VSGTEICSGPAHRLPPCGVQLGRCFGLVLVLVLLLLLVLS